LGWPDVKVIVRDCTAEEARLRMALANLTRASLTMLDRALHVWRVKTIWMRQHPERTHGGFREAGECKLSSEATWTEAIPGKAGLSDRTLARSAEIGEKIDREAADHLRETSVADSQKELLALIKYGEEMQQQIAQEIANGNADTVKAGAALLGIKVEKAALIVSSAKELDRVTKVWAKISDDAKLAFVQVLKNEGFI